jgi:hypothetical protein
MAQPQSRTSTNKSPIFRLRGQNDEFYPSGTLSPENTEILERVNITETGSIRRAFGSAKYNSTQITESSISKTVTGLYQQVYADGTERNFETAGTKVYTDTGTTRTDSTGSLSLTNLPDDRYRFAYAKDQVVATNGVDETWVASDSGAATALSGVPWTTCEDLVVAKNLLISLAPTVGGTKFPTRLQWCDINTSTFELDITNWPSDSIYELYEGSEVIIGGVEFRGRLFVVKADGVYPISIGVDNGFIEVFADDSLQPLRGEFTPVAKNSIVALPNFMFVVAEDGAYRINPDLTYDLVTQRIQETWNALNKGRLKFAHSFVRQSDHQVRTLLSSSTNSTGHDRILVYDYQTNDVWIEPLSNNISFVDEWSISNEKFDITGSTDGYVRKGNDSGQTSDDGTDISWRIRGAANDLGHPGVTKTIIQLITYYKSKGGQQTITSIVYRDDGLEKNRSTNLVLGTLLNYNAGQNFNTGLKYGGGTTSTKGFFVNRGCDTVSPQWGGTEDFELIGYQVEYQITE